MSNSGSSFVDGLMGLFGLVIAANVAKVGVEILAEATKDPVDRALAKATSQDPATRALEKSALLDAHVKERAARMGMDTETYAKYLTRKMKLDASLAQERVASDNRIQEMLIQAGLERDAMNTSHRAEMEKIREAAAHTLHILEAENNALKERLNLESELRVKEANKEAKRNQKALDKELERKIREAIRFVEIRLRERRELDRLDRERMKADANAEIEFGIRSTSFLGHERISLIQDDIDKLNEQIEGLKRFGGLFALGTEDEKKKLERRKKAYYREIYAIEKGLHKTDNKKGPKGSSKAAPRNPRDAR